MSFWKLDASDVVSGLAAIGLALFLLSGSPARADEMVGMATLTKVVGDEMLLCDPLQLGCGGLIGLSIRLPKRVVDYSPDVSLAQKFAPNYVHPANSEDITVPGDSSDFALSTNPRSLVIVHFKGNNKYIGPMSQVEAMPYVDAGADYVVEDETRYAELLKAAAPLSKRVNTNNTIVMVANK